MTKRIIHEKGVLVLSKQEFELLEHIVYFYTHQYEEDLEKNIDEAEHKVLMEMMKLHNKLVKKIK